MSLRHRRVPPDAEAIVAAQVAHWRLLDDDERARLLEVVSWLLVHKHWEAARGFALDDRIRVTVAALAALPLLYASVDRYRLVSSIIVYPSTALSRGERQGPIPGTRTDSVVAVHGLAHAGRGPVLIAWDQALAAAGHPERGHNVVLHEFAHKIDMLDGQVNGTPPLPRAELDDWIRTCDDVYLAMRAGEPRPPLRRYGATNAGEFFAVATEAFFDRPLALRSAEPALHALFVRYHGQDPAVRVLAHLSTNSVAVVDPRPGPP